MTKVYTVKELEWKTAPSPWLGIVAAAAGYSYHIEQFVSDGWVLYMVTATDSHCLQNRLPSEESARAAAQSHYLSRMEEGLVEVDGMKIDPCSDIWENAVHDGYNAMRKSHAGARGQTLSPVDGPEYWVCQAYLDALASLKGQEK
ncbi:hypothetical protein FF098_014610 [Parvularcula flava]|uniref:Uncharacterized protein n=1 Tax=Aquisalinus luteolus TaxID=1566827 RepID=A0A8J3A5C3_9PROT|nr:hypothetical protein [Aquisalinus luteolus]NHK29149.1 hypothetical protein [Aquisalinus luteolus]GGI00155.1 hypothetical protein GCM10011355_27780 [Aquisalinus luteolus]